MKEKYGYLCSIDNNKVFIIAENIASCMDSLQELANGKPYFMLTMSSVPVYDNKENLLTKNEQETP